MRLFVALSLVSAAAGFGVSPADSYCEQHDALQSSPLKSAVFDPPTAAEMTKLFDRMATFDFGDEGADIVLTAPPLPKPDGDRIQALFGGDSLATAKESPSGKPIWGGIQTTYISRIDVFPTSKAETLAYLAGDGDAPARYAQINVAFGQLQPPKFTEYKVGPLDAEAADMTVEKIADQLWGSRPREGNEMRALKFMVDAILNEEEMRVICEESFAGKYHGVGLNNHEPAPPGLVGAERHTQILVNFAVKGTWRGKDLNIVPLSWTINNTDGDPSKWTASDFYYNLQGPFTRDELVAKYNDDSLTKVSIPESHFDEIQKSSFPERRENLPERPYASLPGPRSYMPEGPRYDVHGRTVRWMDWEFHIGYTFRSGPDFHNIKFKGESVAYQVALNEIGLLYSADDPVAGNVFFLDATFGNGEYRELMRGIDCPDYATYLTNYWWAAPGGAQTALRSTCIYEKWDGGALWRRGGPFVSGLRNDELVVRFAMPNGNYDYTLTYTFRLDGTLRVEIASSGFIQTHFWGAERKQRDSMAYKVHTYTGGSLHDHTYGFKVDLDVGSPQNSFQTIEYKMGSTLDALNEDRDEKYTEKPAYLLFDKMRYTSHATVQTEDEALMNVNPATPKSWIFGDTTNLNKWGNMKAYKLSLDQNPQAVIDPDHPTMPAFSYSKQHLAVTRHHDDGLQTISGPYDLNRLDSPQGAFLDTHVNGESIVQEDLVAWVTLVTHHLPTAEDMPMTNSISHGFTLKPWNFFDENPTMDMPHYLRMHPGEEPGDSRKQDIPEVESCVPAQHETDHTFAGV